MADVVGTHKINSIILDAESTDLSVKWENPGDLVYTFPSAPVRHGTDRGVVSETTVPIDEVPQDFTFSCNSVDDQTLDVIRALVKDGTKSIDFNEGYSSPKVHELNNIIASVAIAEGTDATKLTVSGTAAGLKCGSETYGVQRA